MVRREQLIARWTKRIPGLDGEWNHWWLEGDGGLVLVTSSLSELLNAIEANYGRALRLVVSRARHSPAGDLIPEPGYNHVVADFEKDAALGWHD
jgi:hypothetical protein